MDGWPPSNNTMGPSGSSDQTNSNLEFIREFRECVYAYLHAVDGWEAAYQKFYRLRGTHQRLTPDMDQAQHAYVVARGRLESRIPRARQLCARFDARDPWPGLLRIELGANTPQLQNTSALGRNERLAMADCLAYLELRCAESGAAPPQPGAEPANRGLLRRIIDYFV